MAILDTLGVDAGGDVRRVLHEGGPVPEEETAFRPDYEFSSRRVPAFDPGFDLAATLRTGTVEGFRQEGPAARAGLREGMRVVDLENAAPWVGRWDPAEPTVVLVEVRGERRRISFDARGPAKEVPAFLPVER